MFNKTYSVNKLFAGYALSQHVNWPDDTKRIAGEILRSELPAPVATRKTVKKGAFNVLVGKSVSQAYQLGNALAQFHHGQWSVIKQAEGVYLLKNVATSDVYLVSDFDTLNPENQEPTVRRLYTRKPGDKTPIHILGNMAFNVSPVYDICENVRLAAGDAVVNAWTWYHILARFMASEAVAVVTDHEVERDILEGYRQQRWEMAGLKPHTFPRRLDRFICEQNGADLKLYIKTFRKGQHQLQPVAVNVPLTQLIEALPTDSFAELA